MRRSDPCFRHRTRYIAEDGFKLGQYTINWYCYWRLQSSQFIPTYTSLAKAAIRFLHSELAMPCQWVRWETSTKTMRRLRFLWQSKRLFERVKREFVSMIWTPFAVVHLKYVNEANERLRISDTENRDIVGIRDVEPRSIHCVSNCIRNKWEHVGVRTHRSGMLHHADLL